MIEAQTSLAFEQQDAEYKYHICNHLAVIMRSEFQSSLSSALSLKVKMLQEETAVNKKQTRRR